MLKYFLIFLLLPVFCFGQKARIDTIEGIVTYTAPSDLIHISKGNYHTYTVEAIEVRTDTGIIAIHTDLGYLDLKKLRIHPTE